MTRGRLFITIGLVIIIISMVALNAPTSIPLPSFTDRTQINGMPLLIEGEQELTIIPVFFPDQNSSTTIDDLNSLVFNNLSQYFHDQSYGKVWLSGRVLNWIQVENNVSHYARGSLNSENETEANEAQEGASLFRDEVLTDCVSWNDLNFSRRVMIIYAGERSIHPHMGNDTSTLYSFGSPREVAVVNELGWDVLSTMAHELAHCFGLEDIYRKDDQRISKYLTAWALMDENNAWTPAVDICGYSRLSLGWIDSSLIVDVKKNCTTYIEGLNFWTESNPKIIRIPIDQWRYYLIEARCNRGYLSGILITQIDCTKEDGGYGRIDMARNFRGLSDISTRYHGAFQVGEKYVDSENGIIVDVYSQNSKGYFVSIYFGNQSGFSYYSVNPNLGEIVDVASTTTWNNTNYIAICAQNADTDNFSIYLYKFDNDLTEIDRTPTLLNCSQPSLVTNRENQVIMIYSVKELNSFSIMAQTTEDLWIVSGHDNATNPSSVGRNGHVFVAYENHTTEIPSIAIVRNNITIWNDSMSFLSYPFLQSITSSDEGIPLKPELVSDGGVLYLAITRIGTEETLEVYWHYPRNWSSIHNFSLSSAIDYQITSFNGWGFILTKNLINGESEIYYCYKEDDSILIDTIQTDVIASQFVGGIWTAATNEDSIHIKRVWNEYRKPDLEYVENINDEIPLIFTVCSSSGTPTLLLISTRNEYVHFRFWMVSNLSSESYMTSSINYYLIVIGASVCVVIILGSYFKLDRIIIKNIKITAKETLGTTSTV